MFPSTLFIGCATELSGLTTAYLMDSQNSKTCHNYLNYFPETNYGVKVKKSHEICY